MNSAPTVHIILINWNNWQDTFDCLRSLRELSYPNYAVTVVDNASTNDSVERLRQAHPDTRLIAETTNWGFAEGNNIGIRDALAQGADYVWLLNNDTVVAPDSLSRLVEAMQADPSLGTVGPKIYFASPDDMIWFVGADFNPLLGKSVHRSYKQLDRSGQWETNEQTAFVTGCALLIRADVLHEIGLLDPDFFFIAEDLDFGLRVRASGWGNMIAPAARIWHKVSASSGGGRYSPHNHYYATRNRLLIMKKHARLWHWPLFLLHFCASAIGGSVVLYLEGKISFACLDAVRLAIKDFSQGHFGSAPPATQRKITLSRPAYNKPAL